MSSDLGYLGIRNLSRCLFEGFRLSIRGTKNGLSISMMSSSKSKQSRDYPAPLIVEPLREHHTSMIVLHGRGSNAQTFGPTLLDTKLTNGRTFREALPNVRFVFPTASFRRSTAMSRVRITQWFDNYSLDDTAIRPELQIDGIRESSQFLHGLIEKEAESVGVENVVLGGLSQGCATMLISLLLWQGPPIGAAFGMSGRLPFVALISNNFDIDGDLMGEENPFEQSVEIRDVSSNEHKMSAYGKAVKILREELDLPSHRLSGELETSIFLGHGVDDEKVRCCLGEEAFHTLQTLGCKVTWRAYEGLGHWYHEQELDDIVEFVQGQGLQV